MLHFSLASGSRRRVRGTPDPRAAYRSGIGEAQRAPRPLRVKFLLVTRQILLWRNLASQTRSISSIRYVSLAGGQKVQVV